MELIKNIFILSLHSHSFISMMLLPQSDRRRIQPIGLPRSTVQQKDYCRINGTFPKREQKHDDEINIARDKTLGRNTSLITANAINSSSLKNAFVKPFSVSRNSCCLKPNYLSEVLLSLTKPLKWREGFRINLTFSPMRQLGLTMINSV